jgi:hypothetical protein
VKLHPIKPSDKLLDEIEGAYYTVISVAELDQDGEMIGRRLEVEYNHNDELAAGPIVEEYSTGPLIGVGFKYLPSPP